MKSHVVLNKEQMKNKDLVRQFETGGFIVVESGFVPQQVDFESVKKEAAFNMSMQNGEWIAARLLDDHKLLDTLPPLFYSYYYTWISACKNSRYHSELFEKYFRNLKHL